MNTAHFKEKLEEELRGIESKIGDLGRPNPDRAGDWQATAGGFDADPAEPEEQAQKFAEEENNEAVLMGLEARMREINGALERIKGSTYGTCNVCGKEIEEDRLAANPAAQTCKKHLESESNH